MLSMLSRLVNSFRYTPARLLPFSVRPVAVVDPVLFSPWFVPVAVIRQLCDITTPGGRCRVARPRQGDGESDAEGARGAAPEILAASLATAFITERRRPFVMEPYYGRARGLASAAFTSVTSITRR